MKMDEVEKQTCGFCNRDTSIKSIEGDEIWYPEFPLNVTLMSLTCRQINGIFV